MNVRSTMKPRKSDSLQSSRGRVDFERIQAVSEAQIAATSPPELKNLPPEFWSNAAVVPAPKQAISLRVDQDVLEWFRAGGPRYQTRMNAVLRAYVTRMQAK